MQKKIVLTVKEVADLLDVSTQTIYVMARLGEIPTVKVRGKVLFHRQTIEEWVLNGGSNQREEMVHG